MKKYFTNVICIILIVISVVVLIKSFIIIDRKNDEASISDREEKIEEDKYTDPITEALFEEKDLLPILLYFKVILSKIPV